MILGEVILNTGGKTYNKQQSYYKIHECVYVLSMYVVAVQWSKHL